MPTELVVDCASPPGLRITTERPLEGAALDAYQAARLHGITAQQAAQRRAGAISRLRAAAAGHSPHARDLADLLDVLGLS